MCENALFIQTKEFARKKLNKLNG